MHHRISVVLWRLSQSISLQVFISGHHLMYIGTLQFAQLEPTCMSASGVITGGR